MQTWRLSDAEYDRLNPPPPEETEVIDGERWVMPIVSPEWLPVGYIPTPRNNAEWFVYHFVHGLWMRYPLWAVILFCLDSSNYPGSKDAE